MRFLKLVITFVATSTIFAQRFMQDKTTPSPDIITGKNLYKIRYCNEKKDCDTLPPMVPNPSGCMWLPKHNVGQCVHIDANNALVNTFDDH
jgi:hypothetical protein